MNKPSPVGSQTYAASQRKTFHSVLCHLLQTEFPATFGPAVTRLFADKISELHERCYPPLSRVKVGQVLWLAVAAEERPSRSKRIEDTRLVPVLLDLVTPQDIHDAVSTGKRLETRRDKILRLFQQAHQQGAVLGHADVSLLLHLEATTVSRVVLEHEKATGRMLPRRGTLHDMGRSVSHKAIICYKRLVENKPTSQVAQETYHCPEEVEYYVQCCRRVQLCRDNAMTPEEIALATGHTLSLVHEYLNLLEELGMTSGAKQARKDSEQPKQR
jgi:hypothetical protein